jgi:hypothetical protein
MEIAMKILAPLATVAALSLSLLSSAHAVTPTKHHTAQAFDMYLYLDGVTYESGGNKPPPPPPPPKK